MSLFAAAAAKLNQFSHSRTHASRNGRRFWAAVNLPTILAAVIWRRLLRNVKVVAVSGSRGKTATKELLGSILSTRFDVVRTPSSSNGRFGIPHTILSIRRETEFAVVEIGVDRPGIMWKAALVVKPDMVVLTSVENEHSENFLTLEATAREKERLVKSLTPQGVAILNLDDPRVAAMAHRPKASVMTYGLAPAADLRADQVQADWPQRLRFRATLKGESHLVSTQLVGAHWVTAVLAALAASLACGVSLAEAVDAIAHFEPFHGRLQPVVLPSGATMLRDEYNGSVGTLAAALRVMENAQAQRKITILSDFTDDPRPAGPRLGEVGRRVAQFADIAVFVGENSLIGASAVREAKTSGCRVLSFRSLPECAAFLALELREGDLALLKGRNADHLSRIYWSLLEPVACQKWNCSRRMLCDKCPELFGPSAAWAPAHAESWSRRPISPTGL